MTSLPSLARRDLLLRAMVIVGAAATGGLSIDALAKAKEREKPYLDEPTFLLLSAIADTIIPRTDTPGALDSKVPTLIDAMLVNWASPDRRFQISQSLLTINALARNAKEKGFADLSLEERTALLKPHDIAALKPVAQSKAGSIASITPVVADPGYSKLKELVVVLHYFSEPALTHDLPYEHVPGKWIPSLPVTAETRAPGGANLI